MTARQQQHNGNLNEEALADWAIDELFTDATGLNEQITVDFDDNFY